MVSRQNIAGYPLAEIYTRIIPGSLVLLPGIITLIIFSRYEFSEIPISPGAILIFLILSLIVGEYFHNFAFDSGRTPRDFRRLLYVETGNVSFLLWRDRLRAKDREDLNKKSRMLKDLIDVSPGMKSRVEAPKTIFHENDIDLIHVLENDLEIEISYNSENDDDGTSAESIHSLLFKRMQGELTPQTMRLYHLSVMSGNIFNVLVWSAILFLSIMAGQITQRVYDIPPIFMSALLIVVASMAYIGSRMIFGGHGRDYVQKLLCEYYHTASLTAGEDHLSIY